MYHDRRITITGMNEPCNNFYLTITVITQPSSLWKRTTLVEVAFKTCSRQGKEEADNQKIKGSIEKYISIIVFN